MPAIIAAGNFLEFIAGTSFRDFIRHHPAFIYYPAAIKYELPRGDSS
jgi:hypothetical protein